LGRKIEREEVHTIRVPDLECEPKQYHQNMAPDLFKNTSILSLNAPLVAGEVIGQSTIAAEILGAIECLDDTCDERMLSKIEAVFQWLHAKLLPPPQPRVSNQTGIAFGVPIGKTIDEFVQEDKSILHRCMYALSTGKTIDKMLDGVLWDNQHAVSFAISDMIHNLACKSMGSLKSIIGGQLLEHNAGKTTYKILNKFGVAPSQQYLRLQNIKMGEELFLFGLKNIDPHVLYLILFDNIGFKKGGSDPGWLQFTAV